jgi:6-phosphogluconolactonase (cycloisomerase 2 family)
MPRILLLALIGACASTVLASAQAAPSPTEVSDSTQATSSPAAYVYVSSYLSSKNANQIDAYSAASNGALTPIPGSPYPYNVNYMALTGSWLFGVANLDEDLDSFSIGSNGALTLKDSLTVVTNGNGLISDYLDHTGATLYADLYSTNNDYLSYSIDKSTGRLTQVGDLPGGPPNNSPVSFIGNNVFAYSSSCYQFAQEIIGVQRNTDGTLSYLNNFNPPFPAEKSGGFYCPWFAAADPTDRLAIAMEPLTSNWAQDGAWQLATYTADASGDLTTTSTYTNMPKVLVGAVTDYWMSPSGKFLAVGGTAGLQIFHFNGANPITKYTGLLTTKEVDQVLWDNSNHLYAIGRTAGKLWVFTVTSTGVTQAPGSPHSITSPNNMIVLPK